MLQLGLSVRNTIYEVYPMATCSSCGTTILFGGPRVGDMRFCSDKCAENGKILIFSKSIPDDVVKSQALEIFHGLCPICKGKGPVDLYISYRVWSAIIISNWSERRILSCRPCGVKNQIGNTFITLIFGWWGIPHGIINTPINLIRNIKRLLSNNINFKPSGEMEDFVRVRIANAIYEDSLKGN